MVDAEIAKVLDIEKWQHLQDSLAKVTNLALIMVDFRGQPLTVHSENRNFCQMVRHHPELSKYCEKCDARGSIEAVRTNQPFIYRCHFDIVDISIPIMFNNHLVGALMAGQVKLATGHEELEQILQIDTVEKKTFLKEHQELYQKIPQINFDNLQ